MTVLHPLARRVIELQKNNQAFRFVILTLPLAKISAEACLFWTIEQIEQELKRLPQNELSVRSLKEINKLRSNATKEKATIFDELSHKNWANKSTMASPQQRVSIHLPLARISWSCLYFVCWKNNFAFTSNYHVSNDIPRTAFPSLVQAIANECSSTLDIVSQHSPIIIEKVAMSYSELMSRLKQA